MTNTDTGFQPFDRHVCVSPIPFVHYSKTSFAQYSVYVPIICSQYEFMVLNSLHKRFGGVFILMGLVSRSEIIAVALNIANIQPSYFMQIEKEGQKAKKYDKTQNNGSVKITDFPHFTKYIFTGMDDGQRRRRTSDVVQIFYLEKKMND